MNFLFFSSLVISAIHATSIDGHVSLHSKLGVPEWLDRAKLFSDLRVVLVSKGNEIARTTPNKSGVFKLNFISTGHYIAYFSHPFLKIDPVSLEVNGDLVSASVYDPIKVGLGMAIAYPLKIAPSAFQSPFTAEEEFNAFQIFKNPMVIMGLLLVGLVWLMPKLQGEVSQEEMREMRKGLAEDGGLAASFLKNMIPAGPSENPATENLPSLTLGKKNQ